MTYAAKTEVSSEKSRAEIERTLERYGADAFAYAVETGSAVVMFRMAGREIRFNLAMPSKDDPTFTTYQRAGRIYGRTPQAAKEQWEQACRQKWRALALVIKAKLEAVEAGISTVEDEFLAATMLPDGATVGQWIRPDLERAYLAGAMPSRLMLEGPR